MAKHVTDDSFEADVLKSALPVVVDFWAPWCGPCRALGPVVDELSEAYAGKVSIVKMNVDENPITPGRFTIRAIPTIIIFKNGQVVEQVAGSMDKTRLQGLIDSKALS